MKNHNSHPTGSEPFPEVNVISSQTHGRGCGRGQNSQHYNNHPSNPFKRKYPFPLQKRNNGETKQEICLVLKIFAKIDIILKL